MCAAISINGALLNKCVIGPYNTDRLLLFLEDLHERLVPEVERGQVGDLSIYVITWDNVAFRHSRAVTAWFDAHSRMMSLFVAPYSPFLNPIEEFFSAWRWKVFWPSSTGPNVPPGCNGCCMPRHHSWTLPGVDKAYQKILPKMPCQRRYQVWCGWEHVAKRRRPDRLDYIYYYCIMFYNSSVGFSVCIFI